MQQPSCSIEDIWRGLVRGGVDPKHDWHWPVLATVGLRGEPDARTVVLRAARPQTRELEIHSDSRAGKLLQLNASDGQALLHCYDSRSRTQLRIRCVATVHSDNDVSSAAWQKLSPQTRSQYVDEPSEGRQNVELLADVPEAFFAIVILEAIQIDWLWLAREGHQRQLFTWEANTWSSALLKP
jgi:pyridoxamine 5'-phosphate oxidase